MLLLTMRKEIKIIIEKENEIYSISLFYNDTKQIIIKFYHLFHENFKYLYKKKILKGSCNKHIFNENIKISFLKYFGQGICIGIEAPLDVKIMRSNAKMKED